jgi:hypothetical protein
MQDNQNKISLGAIKTISNYEFTSASDHQVNFILQVLSFKTCANKQKNRNASTVTLSDTTQKRSGFLFFHEEYQDVAAYDLVRVISITPVMIEKNDIKIQLFCVKAFSIEEKCDELFGSPEDYKETHSTKKENDSSEITITKKTITIKTTDNNGNAPKSLPLYALSSFSKDFTIVVKIICKNSMKHFTNNKGDGCLFRFIMMDNEGTEMECTAFNIAAKKVYELLQKDKVYSIKGAYIKINDKKFSSMKNDYKMILEDNVEIKEIINDFSIDESNFKFSFVKISEIESLNPNESIEVIGKVIEVSETREVSTKNGAINLKKLKIADTSEMAIEVSCWRQHADQEFSKGEILIFKNIKISNYNNTKTLNTIENTSILRDLHLPERAELEVFFNNKPNDASFKIIGGDGKGIGDISFLSEVLSALDGNISHDNTPLFKVKATVSSFMNYEKNYYLGCSECSKKIIDESNFDQIKCQSCNKVHGNRNYIYALSIRIKDSKSEEFIDIFGGLAEKLTNMKCNDYMELVESQDEIKLGQLKSEIEYKQFYFLVKPKIQVFNNVARKKIVTLKIEPVDSSVESKRLIGLISQYLINSEI